MTGQAPTASPFLSRSLSSHRPGQVPAVCLHGHSSLAMDKAMSQASYFSQEVQSLTGKHANHSLSTATQSRTHGVLRKPPSPGPQSLSTFTLCLPATSSSIVLLLGRQAYKPSLAHRSTHSRLADRQKPSESHYEDKVPKPPASSSFMTQL